MQGKEGHTQPGWTTSRRGQDSLWKSQSEWQRTGINGERTSMVWPTLGSRTAKEQNTHTQLFIGLLSETAQVGRYQKKHSPTHTHPDRQTSFINFLHLQRSLSSSLSVYVFDSLFQQPSPGPLWSSSWSGTLYFILLAFLHPVIVFFSQHMLIPSQPVLL